MNAAILIEHTHVARNPTLGVMARAPKFDTYKRRPGEEQQHMVNFNYNISIAFCIQSRRDNADFGTLDEKR